MDLIQQILIHGQVYDGASFISLEIVSLLAILNMQGEKESHDWYMKFICLYTTVTNRKNMFKLPPNLTDSKLLEH